VVCLAKPTKLYDSETGCCKRFDPKPWQNKTIVWKNKLFLKGSIACIFYMPFGFDTFMRRSMGQIAKAGALAKTPILLYDAKSPFGADIYIAVEKEVSGSQHERISGNFLSKVFEGEFKDSGKWAEEMKKFAASKGKKMKRLYFYYTTCPACAKVYGHNYVVLLAQI
jgi:hypothetical protein